MAISAARMLGSLLRMGTHQISWTGVATVCLIALWHSPPALATEYYVAPNGSDANPGTEAAPFATLSKARSAVRLINGSMTEDIVVYLRGGTYRLTTTEVFDQADSGFNGFKVIYRSYPGESATISGGQRISGWTADSDGSYHASVGSLRFRQLYVNGIRAQRARTPNAGSYYQLSGWDEGARRIQLPTSTISNWQRLNQVELVIIGKGVNQASLRIASFSPSGSSAWVTPREPERTRLFEQIYPPKEIRPYYFENALEFLDASGEWYLDTSAGEVHYRPRNGEDLAVADVEAPALEQLIKVQGTLASPVHDIEFQQLSFFYSTWLLPNDEGFIGDQGFNVFVEVEGPDDFVNYPGHRHPAAVHVEAANDIRFERNVFRNLGSSGLNLYSGTQDVVVEGNAFLNIAATGIAADLSLEGNPTDPRAVTRRPVIKNNYIRGIGRDYLQNVGIGLGYVDGAIVEHNELTEMPYSGISVGWGWADRPNVARDDLVRYNEIWNVLRTMSDGGGIYTLSRQPGTEIAENYVHDIVRTPVVGEFNVSGIYLDIGSNFITVRDNVLLNSGDTRVYEHATGSSNVLSNNNGSSSTVIANAGLEPAYTDIRQPTDTPIIQAAPAAPANLVVQ